MRKKLYEPGAVWWTCPLERDGDTLRPIPPFRPYNPFAEYFSIDQVKSGKKSLPYRFLAVNATNIEEIESFCERYGLLGPTNRRLELIDTLFADSFRKFSGPLQWRSAAAPIANASPEASLIERYGHGLGGYNAIEEMDRATFAAEQASMRELVHWITESKGKLNSQDRNDIRLLLQVRLNYRLSQAPPHLTWDEQAGWVMGWDICSLRQAMYLMLLFDLIGPGRILNCRRCKNPFLAGRDWTVFCSPQCKSNFHMPKKRRQRAKRDGKKGGNHGAQGRARSRRDV